VSTISSPGVGSSLDVKTIVSQLMTVEQQPLKLLNTQEASYNAKLSAFGSLKGALSNLQTAAQTLNLSSTYATLKAGVADPSVLSASVPGNATAGSYNIEVQHLAQSQKLVSTGYSNTTSVIGSGTLTIDLGTYSDPGTPPVTFTPNPDASSTKITIDSSNNTLQGVRDAINNAHAGVSATIINDGTNYRLALTSTNSGTKNAVKISVAESGAPGLSQLAYDASTGGTSNMTQNAAAADAVIKVDGVTITKPSNTITDAIQGVTLNLTKQTATGVTTQLTLTRDDSTITNALNSFVTAYNAVNTQIAQSTAFDSTTGTGSILTGDATVRTVQTQLRSALTNIVTGAPSGMSMLSDVGITFQDDGSLALDTNKLNQVLGDPSKDISTLFTTKSNTVGLGSRLNTLVSGMIFGSDSLLTSRMDGINSSIKSVNDQITQQNARLTDIENRYMAQFTALDTLISNMNTTSSFLTQQLASIKANSSSN
jgi:flagellar hook-associated protein 2